MGYTVDGKFGWYRYFIFLPLLLALIWLIEFSPFTEIYLKPIASVKLVNEDYQFGEVSAVCDGPSSTCSNENSQISLPSFWPRDTSLGLRAVEYKFGLPKIEESNTNISSDSFLSLVLAQQINGGDYFLNDKWIASTPRSTEVKRVMNYAPFKIDLPNRYLNTDGSEDVISVIVWTREPYWIFPKIYIGTNEDASRYYELAMYASKILSVSSNIFCVALSIVMLLAWIIAPHKKVFLLSGLATGLWSILYSLALISEIDVSAYREWRTILFVSESGLVFIMTKLVLAQCGFVGSRIFNYTFVFVSIVGPVSYIALGPSIENELNMYWTPVLVGFYAYAILLLFLRCLTKYSFISSCLLVQSLLSLILAYHDVAVLVGFMPTDFAADGRVGVGTLFFEPIFLSHLGLPVLLLVMSVLLLREYQDGITKIYGANKLLNSSLEALRLELEESFCERRRLVQLTAMQNERERIYQEMHDGLGSKLSSISRYVKTKNRLDPSVIHSLDEAHDELRAIVRSRSESTDFYLAVFSFCTTTEERLAEMGIGMCYNIGDDVGLTLRRNAHFQLLRTIQEAVSNSIKYSQASKIRVKVKSVGSSLEIMLADNGVGFAKVSELVRGYSEFTSSPSNLELSGRGLYGAYSKCVFLGGALEVRDMMPGVGLFIQIPLDSIRSEGVSDFGELSSITQPGNSSKTAIK